MKKKWDKPELIVLVRGRPEEKVLMLCKLLYAHGGPLDDDTGCINFGCASPCDPAGMAGS